MFLSNTSSYYPFLQKDSSLESFKTVSTASFYNSTYSEELSGSYPLSSSIDVLYMPYSASYSSERRKIYSLINILNSYTKYSPNYAYSSSYGDKSIQELNLISIPSIFFGSSINKGSVELSFYVSGTLLAKIEDINKNGELIQTTGSNGSGSVAGVVLYNEGFIIITGSWNLDDNFTETYIYDPSPTITNPKWIYWGAGLNNTGSNATLSSSFDLNFKGINYINTLTMMAHAEKGELNHSNNPTYINFSSASSNISNVTSKNYSEAKEIPIKNTIKYAYENFSGSLEKQTYISRINLYDENKNLIGVVKVSKPIRKPENRDLTFKLKLDI